MEQFQRFLTKYFRTIGTCYALDALRHMESHGVASLQERVRPKPENYQSSSSYGADALVHGITSKLCLPGDASKRSQATKDDFWLSEHQCLNTNKRLRRHRAQLIGQCPVDLCDLQILTLIEDWRREVKACLGPLPVRLDPTFSGGSTLSDAGKQTTIPDKMSSIPTLYQGGYAVWTHTVQDTVLDRHAPIFVRANKFFEVPKDSQKNRGCCMEASGSLMMQLAVGTVLKKRYQKRYQVDLRYAKPIHMGLAKRASMDGSMATIDLSRASDTVANELVKLLLPTLWYDLLNSLRATHTTMDGKAIRLEKFSSMGNGYTFELETILFRSLAAVLMKGEGEAYVFGDDILISARFGALICSVLTYFGFTPNPKKTFCEGPFRESCGGDFFTGVDVRPHFVKELPVEPQHWLALANGLNRLGLGKTAPWWFCVDQVPQKWRIFGPSSLGDGCFNDDTATPYLRLSRIEPGYLRPFWAIWVPVHRAISLSAHFTYEVATAAACLGVKSRVPLRDSVIGHRLRYVTAWGIRDLD